MNAYLDRFSDTDFESALSVQLFALSNGKMPSTKPYAFLLGGQNDAGKTRLHDILKNENGTNDIVINGDELRKLHPNFDRIQERYGMDAPAHTAAWSRRMTEALIDVLSQRHYNLVIEGTLRTSEVPLKTATLLRERGYDVSLAIMAVKPEISLISCQIRYEMMRLAGTVPRATDPAHHSKIVHEIAGNLATLEQSGLFDSICLYDRSARCLYPSDQGETASEALSRVLFGAWTEEETDHYQYLQEKIANLK